METLKHECGVALIRLLKPLEYYQEKYGTWMYGLNKLYLLMEKQHNRGQEAAGLACVKLQANPGEEYMFRERGLGAGAITEIFNNVHQQYKDLTEEQLHDAEFAKKCLPFAGELYMGHLRYSTTGKDGILVCSSISPPQQLACQEPGIVRQLQSDQCRRNLCRYY